MATIVQKDDPVLRKIADPVPAEKIGSAELKKVIRDMKSALNAEDDGVAIAAPQIGVSMRIFILSGRIIEMLYPEEYEDSKKKADDIVFINPEIIKLSREKAEMEEGCLSVRYLYGKIYRSKKARVAALDEKGKKFEMGGSGLLAQIFQHETDHLDGKLFIDEATDVHDLPPQKENK